MTHYVAYVGVIQVQPFQTDEGLSEHSELISQLLCVCEHQVIWARICQDADQYTSIYGGRSGTRWCATRQDLMDIIKDIIIGKRCKGQLFPVLRFYLSLLDRN